MSVTTVLVPVLEPEAEALFEGGPAAEQALAEALERARKLRPEVARVDAIREELHDLLFPKWSTAKERAPSLARGIFKLFRKPEPAPASTGYDPFVHLFGRSFPLDGVPRTVAEALARLVDSSGSALTDLVGTHLRGLDARAEQRYLATPTPAIPSELDDRFRRQLASIRDALAARPPKLSAAVDALARIEAWSHPVWRLDGEMLPDLLRTLGVGVAPGRAASLFEILGETRADVRDAVHTLPARLPDFAGAGAFLTSGEVKSVAGALRLQRLTIAKNAAESGESAPVVMRHARLLEEAVLFCEARGLALLEAAGVEWHER